jgi:ribonucleoside-diphosphate reductase alpha chain
VSNLEGIRRKVFMDRYALKGVDGTPLEDSPEQMWRRVADAIADVETTADSRSVWRERFYNLLRDFKFVPGGRILSGAGTGHDVSFYNCFVVGVGEDPLDPSAPRRQFDPAEARTEFFTSLGEMTDIMSRSGGVGMNLSALPPEGTPIPTEGSGRAVRPSVALSFDHPDVGLMLDERDGPNLRNVNVAVILPPGFDSTSDLWDRVRTSGVTVLRPEDVTLGLGDSRQSIIMGARQCAMDLLHGKQPVIDFSELRPKGAYIKTVNGTSSGPVSWMYLFDAVARLDDGTSATEKGVIHFAEIASTITGKTIQQGGTRRGALMVMLDDDHPDIEEFIAAKRIGPDGRPVMIEHANMSVCVSDAFMAAVQEDMDWDLKWQGEVVRTVNARDIWDQICTAAWSTAEPGMVFMERYQSRSNTYYCENIRCVNPCGEQGLSPGSVCNLGAINLACYVDKEGWLLEDDLARDTAYAVRFLDDVIDATPYFSDLHVKMQRDGIRRIGLGTMGLADALIKMGMAYGSEQSLRAIHRIYSTIRDAAYGASVELAREKGSFGLFDRDKYLDGWFIRRLPQDIQAEIREHGIRNGVLLTQAPTGTTSLLAGVSSGIEPVYDFAMKRVDRTGEHMLHHPLYQEWSEANPGQEKPAYFVGAKDLTPEQHVSVQAWIQKFTDSSISKTVNGPNDDTVEDVKMLYLRAYLLGCKGVTYYRDGSRDAILTSVDTSTIESPVPLEIRAPGERVPLLALPDWISEGRLKRRPSVIAGLTRNVTAPEGKVNITINSDEDGPLEVFINVGRAGSDIAALAEALGRLISLQLRLPSTMGQDERLQQVAQQLRGIGGSRSVGFGPNRVLSLPDAVAQAIMAHTTQPSADSIVIESAAPEVRMTGNLCPQCGSSGSYVYEEGCKKCHNCGHSEC